jgi:hypothetical protein
MTLALTARRRNVGVVEVGTLVAAERPLFGPGCPVCKHWSNHRFGKSRRF